MTPPTDNIYLGSGSRSAAVCQSCQGISQHTCTGPCFCNFNHNRVMRRGWQLADSRQITPVCTFKPVAKQPASTVILLEDHLEIIYDMPKYAQALLGSLFVMCSSSSHGLGGGLAWLGAWLRAGCDAVIADNDIVQTRPGVWSWATDSCSVVVSAGSMVQVAIVSMLR